MTDRLRIAFFVSSLVSRVLERRGDVLPGPPARARTRAATRSRSTSPTRTTAAAPRHRRSAVGARRRLGFGGRGRARALPRGGARRRSRREGERRRRARRAARGARRSSCAGPGTASRSGTSTPPRRSSGSRPDPRDPFRPLVPRYDLVLHLRRRRSGRAARYEALGARRCVPIYNALDPETHHPVAPEPRFACDLAFLGNRLPDREARVERVLPRGRGAPARAALPPRGRRVGRQSRSRRTCATSATSRTARSQRAELQRPRCAERARATAWRANGFSPPTRVFEAAGAGACLVTDAWEGIDAFLEPGPEVLVARDGAEVAQRLARARPGAGARDRRRGAAARARRSTRTRTGARGGRGGARIAAERARARHAELGGERRDARSPRHRHPRAVDHVVVGQRPRDHVPRARSRALAPWPPRAVPRARRALVRRRTATCRRRRTAARSCTASLEELRERFAPALRRADLVVVGSYVPEGTRSAKLGRRSSRAGTTAFYDIDTPVTLARLARDDVRVPRRRSSSPATTSTCPSPAVPRSRGIERELGAPAARALYCSADPERPPARRRATLRWDLGYLGTYSVDRQPALERLLARARAAPARAALRAWPGRSTPAISRGRRNLDRIEHLAPQRARRVLRRAALHAERHARRHGARRLSRRASGSSRRPPAARR